jgi:uncharacterized protein (TIGR02757 family)
MVADPLLRHAVRNAEVAPDRESVGSLKGLRRPAREVRPGGAVRRRSGKLGQMLDRTYEAYHRPSFLEMDPLVVVRRYAGCGLDSLEIAGLIAASLSYGRVESIVSFLDTLFVRLGPDIRAFTDETTFRKKLDALGDLRYRFNSGMDLAVLVQCIGKIRSAHGALGELFGDSMSTSDDTIGPALHKFVSSLRRCAESLPVKPQPSFGYLLASPESRSACKRMNMYLRWMVRADDGIDLGVWPRVPASKLVMPVDTHVARIARRWGLTDRRTVDWAMAEEITARLRRYSPRDPVKYDFSLCRLGMVNTRQRHVHGSIAE